MAAVLFRRLVYVALFLTLFLLCVLPVLFLAGIILIPKVQEWQLRQTLVTIEDSEHLFAATEQFNGSYQTRRLFYWSDQPVDSVETFYQPFTSGFVAMYNGHRFARWGKSTSLPSPETATRSKYACNYTAVLECVNVIIIDLEQDVSYEGAANLLNRAINSEELPSDTPFPHRGTLIVFTYTVYDYS